MTLLRNAQIFEVAFQRKSQWPLLAVNESQTSPSGIDPSDDNQLNIYLIFLWIKHMYYEVKYRAGKAMATD